MKKYITLILILSASTFAVLSKADIINMSGSDILQVAVIPEATRLAKKDDITLISSMQGTYTAMKDLKEGQADLGIIAVPRDAKMPEDLIAIPLCYQAAVVIVNITNPLEEISTKQLSDIFSSMTRKRIESWQQMGINNPGFKGITSVTTNFSDGVVVELFKHTSMEGSNIASWVHIALDSQNVYNMIKANNAAIAIVGKLSPSQKNLIKTIAVSKSNQDDSKSYSFRPDQDSVFNGDYPMSIPFYVVFKKENIAKVKNTVRILLSDEVAEKVDAQDFYSAPLSSRRKSILELDMMK